MRYRFLLTCLVVLAGCESSKNGVKMMEPPPPPPPPPTTSQTVQAKGTLIPSVEPTIIPPQFNGGIELSNSQLGLDNGMTSTKFDFFQVRDVYVRVKLQSMSTLITLKLEFLDPAGFAFYETNQLYTTDPSMTMGTMMKPGVPPSPTMPAKPIAGGYALDYPVPIAGSVFQRFPKPGAWTVRASVDMLPVYTTPLEVSFGG
jgi:hypothetical protein